MRRSILQAVACALLVLPLPAEGRGDPEESGTASEGVEKGGDRGTYAVRLRDLEDRVNRLKADYIRTRYRLALLAEKYLDRGVLGCRAELRFRNEIGPLFALERVVFTMDGELIYLRVDQDGELEETEEIPLFEGPLPPGDHVIGVVLEYRGQGLPYMDGYLFEVRSSHAITVDPGQSVELDIVGYEKSAIHQVSERPTIRFVERISDERTGSDPAD